MPFPFSNLGRKSQSSARNSSQSHIQHQNQNQTHSRPPSRASTLPIPAPAFLDIGAHISGPTSGSVVNQQHQNQAGVANAESVNHAHPTFGNHNQHSGVVWAAGDPCRSSTRTTTSTATTHSSTASSASSFVEVDNNAEANNAKASYYNTPSVNLNSTPARFSNSFNPNTSYAAADTNSSIYGEAYLAGVIPHSTTPPSFDIAQGRVASPFTYPATPNATYPATLTPTPTSFNHTATLTPNASSTAPTPNSFPPTISCTPPTPGIDFDIAGFEYLGLDSSTLSEAATSAAAFGGTPSSTSPAPRPASPAPRTPSPTPRPNSPAPAPGPGHTTIDGYSTTGTTTPPFATPPPAYSIPAYSIPAYNTPAGESAPSCQSSPPSRTR
ncbi:hypothetical protein BJ165DRAFT_1530218 [Panaeolus papilionaceus]|nr:hypothetical protein BJ165DRAFT_1530218 [Panaeolus papilionaceus]